MYSVGVIDVCALKLLEKWYWLEKPHSSAIAEIFREPVARSCFA